MPFLPPSMSMQEESMTRLQGMENSIASTRSSESSRQRLERRHRKPVSHLSFIIGVSGLDKGVLSIHNLKYCRIPRLISQVNQPQAFRRKIGAVSREIHRSARSRSFVVEGVQVAQCLPLR